MKQNNLTIDMKKQVITLAFLMFTSLVASAQSYSTHDLGDGIAYHLNDEGYIFKIGGVTQSYGNYSTSNGKSVSTLDTRFAYFNFMGEAKEERLKFFLQADFTRPKLLLDGYFTWEAFNDFGLTFGQRQGIANNRELLMYENRLLLIDRSILSSTYAETGREFGVFMDYQLKAGPMILKPALSLTSGDGINSFGVDSRDPDIGGFKYSGRLDLLPLGEFSSNNDQMGSNFMGESTPKLLLGIAASTNIGASDAKGEGHGSFTMYQADGAAAYPTYRKLFVDALFKYKKFNLMAEYGIATASNLDHLYISLASNQFLVPTQISQYLNLGRGYNLQLGQMIGTKWEVQGRYAAVQPEFASNSESLVQNMQKTTLGFTRYIAGNAAKIQVQTGILNDNGTSSNTIEIAMQYAF